MHKESTVSLKDLLKEINWQERKFHRYRTNIQERYQLDLENFKKAPKKLEKTKDDDHYAFPKEIKDLFQLLLKLYDVNPFKGKGKDPLKITLDDLFKFQSNALIEIKKLFNTDNQELISHPTVVASEIELNALEDVIAKQTVLMQILMEKSIEVRASFWGYYSNCINHFILWIYEMEKYTTERIKEEMLGFEIFNFSENKHTSLDFLIAHYIRHKSTPLFKQEKSLFYISLQKQIKEFEDAFFTEDDKRFIDSKWTEEMENNYQENFKHYINNLIQQEIDRHRNKLISPSNFIENYIASKEFIGNSLNEEELNSIYKHLVNLENNTPNEYKKIIETLYSSIIGKSMDHN